MLLFIRADIDVAKTVFGSFNSLGPIPLRPVAFVEFKPFINGETKSIDTNGVVKEIFSRVLLSTQD